MPQIVDINCDRWQSIHHQGGSPLTEGKKMIKTCDECKVDFNIFQGGFGNQFFVVCQDCWATELKRRQTGGVFTRGGK